MKFTIDFQHREFFIKNHFIEFDHLVPPDQLESFQHRLHALLIKRQKKDSTKKSPLSAKDLFMAGYDVWRDEDVLRKFVTNKVFAEIAAELCEKKPLRLAFDQYFPSNSKTISKEKSEYASLLHKKSTLANFSPVQGVVCGLMLCLSGEEKKNDETSQHSPELSLFSETPGNGVYFDQDAIINFEEWSSKENHDYLLIVYSIEKAVYIMQPDNPHSNTLKNFGYVYGDRLKDKLNPILVR
jgi:hypothetical protein